MENILTIFSKIGHLNYLQNVNEYCILKIMKGRLIDYGEV